MNTTIYSFDEIVPNKKYNIQAQIHSNPFSINIQNGGCILSMILIDHKKNKIELIAWNEDKINIQKGDHYHFLNIQSIPNNKYRKTSHTAKLQFTKSECQYKKIKCLEYKKDKIIYVKDIKQRNKKEKLFNKQTSQQTSIKNWLK